MSGRNWELMEVQSGWSSTAEENSNLLRYLDIWIFCKEILFLIPMGWRKCKIRNSWRTKNDFPPCIWSNYNKIIREEKIHMSVLHIFCSKEIIACHSSISQSPLLIINSDCTSHTHLIWLCWWSDANGKIRPKVCEPLPVFCFRLAI